MLNKESFGKSSPGRGRHLALVGGTRRASPHCPSAAAAQTPLDMTTVRQLTHAMMNRLWIPRTTTIVGLLDVGLSRTNFDELSKWIVTQLATVPDGGAANELPRLERRFRRTVDQFPEL